MQWVPMHDVDQALAMLPAGQSEDPMSPYRLSTYQLWAQGELHAAPISRAGVEKITVRRTAFGPAR